MRYPLRQEDREAREEADQQRLAERAMAPLEARIEALEAALRPFAAISGVAVPRRPLPPDLDRLWSYFDARSETQHEITRAHVDEAARVLQNSTPRT